MRSAERELIEIERKRQASDSQSTNAAKPKNAGEIVQERLAEISKQISDEARRLAYTRSQLQKIKNGNGNTSSGPGIKSFFESTEKDGSKKNSSGVNLGGRGVTATVPESLYPELCK